MATSINIPVYSDVLVVLGTAGIVVPIVRRWGVSPVLGYLGAGALLGPLGLGSFIAQAPFLYWFTVVNAENIASIADLGVVFLLFLIGLELSYERLMSMRRLVFGLGGLQVLISTALISGVALAFGQSPSTSILMGSCLALSSTAIVLEILSSQGRLKTSAGRASFVILLAQDLAVVPILMFISILGAKTGGSVYASVGMALVQAAAAVAIIVVVGRVVMRPVFRLVATTQSSELFIAVILFVIIGSGVVAALAGLSMTLGAFVAGLLLAETAYRKAIEATVEPFKGLLLGVFFLTVGMNFDVRELAREPLWLLAALASLIVAKAVIVIVLARLFKLSKSVSIETALLLGPGGEFAFVGIGLAVSLGLLERQVSSFIVALTSLSMVLIPALSSAARWISTRLADRKEPAPELAVEPEHRQKHAIVIGYGRVGKVVCSLLKHHGVSYIAADFGASAVIEDRRKGHDVYFGDATNLEFLKACGVMDAAGIVVTIDSRKVIDEIVTIVRAARPDINIVSRARDAEHARHLYAIGVTDAVPETIEASLQLSEAALVGLGVPTGPVIVSIHEHRDVVRKELQQAARQAQRGDSIAETT